MSAYAYIDLHAHLQFSDFDTDREEIIQRLQEENIKVINVGTTLTTSYAALKLGEAYKGICYTVFGLHPVYAIESKKDLEIYSKEVERYAVEKKIQGIGECGLDYFRIEGQNIEDISHFQEVVFETQIQLAKKHKLPLMLHVRESYKKTLEILSKHFTPSTTEYRGNAHFFVGSIEEAQAFLDLGFSISFTGVITFVKEYEELVRYIPLDRMFAETDSPYVSPKPHRGKRNIPIHVIDIYKKIAEIKEIPLETVKEVFYKNAQKFWLKD